MAEVKRIDLSSVRTSPSSRVFSGRERGLAAREKFNLNVLDHQSGGVTVVIPEGTYSMNMSFFLGMFGDSVRELGRDEFRQKYLFESDPVHLQSIEEGVNRALKESFVLPEKKKPPKRSNRNQNQKQNRRTKKAA